MAFNCADTRQRAYNRIDTSNPHGNWVDERSYNKTGTAGRRTLVGNWQEDEKLERDMKEHGHDQTVVRKEGKYFKGGFESTAYLLSEVEKEDRKAEGVTMQRQSFNDTNGDIKTQQKAPLGVRSQIRAEMVVAEAKAIVAQQEKAVAAASAPPPMSSTYRDTVNRADGPQRRVVNDAPGEKRTYVGDKPITLYTGNPQTGARMRVQGATTEGGTGNPLAKNTNFTCDRFAIGMIK